MKFLDLAGAALVCFISLSLVASMDPVPFDSAARTYREEAALRGVLLKVLDDGGVPRLRGQPWAQVCHDVSGYTNSSVTVSAVVSGRPCQAAPQAHAEASTLTLPFSSGAVTLVAWASEGR